MGRHEAFSASDVLASKFGKLTGFVHSLARRLQESELRLGVLRKRCARLRDLLGRKRTPVLVETYANGEVWIYAEHGTVELAQVDWPRGKFKGEAHTTVEEWLTEMLGERHRAIYLPSCVERRIYPDNGERWSLTEAYAAYEKMLIEVPVLRVLMELRREREQELRDTMTLKGKETNAETKASDNRTA